MEVVVTTGAIRLAKFQSNRHRQQTNTQFFTGRVRFLLPNQQCQNTERKNISFHGLAHPNLALSLPSLSLTTSGFWTLEEGCHASRQPIDASSRRILHKHVNKIKYTVTVFECQKSVFSQLKIHQ